MAATADILQRCYTGLETREDALWLHPRLPDAIDALDFDLRYRGHWLTFQITHEQIAVRAMPSAAPPVTVMIDDHRYVLHSGTQITADSAPS
jgi:trehalose/maltose hydrolase-like predicted phosphorylase